MFASEVGPEGWPGHTGNRGRWENDRGALNLIDATAVLRARDTIREGRTFACARPMQFDNGTTQFGDVPAMSHRMTEVSTDGFLTGQMTQVSHDEWSLTTHGMTNTHIDALAHVGYRGLAFNNAPFNEVVTPEHGADALDTVTLGVIVTRCILIDVAKNLGRELRPGEAVKAEHLAQDVGRIEPGDAVLVRTGADWKKILADGSTVTHGTGVTRSWPGLGISAVDLLASFDVSVIGSDTAGEAIPYELARLVHSPAHILAESFYGIPLLHNMELGEIAGYSNVQQRQEFMIVIAPLLLPKGTGSLVTPVVIA